MGEGEEEGVYMYNRDFTVRVQITRILGDWAQFFHIRKGD